MINTIHYCKIFLPIDSFFIFEKILRIKEWAARQWAPSTTNQRQQPAEDALHSNSNCRQQPSKLSDGNPCDNRTRCNPSPGRWRTSRAPAAERKPGGWLATLMTHLLLPCSTFDRDATPSRSNPPTTITTASTPSSALWNPAHLDNWKWLAWWVCLL